MIVALIGIEHVEARREIAEAVPALVRAQHPFVAVADAFGGEALRSPHLEPPVLAELRVDLAHRAAKVDRLLQRFFDEGRPARGLHHRGRHVAGGDDRVLRGGRRVHVIRLVERMQVQHARPAVLHQYLRGLRKSRQQLVRRLRRENHRLLARRAIAPDRMHVLVVLVKRRVRQPGFVEMQRLDFAVEHLLDRLDVIENAVVRALREREHARLRLHVARERIGLDFLLDILPAEFVTRDRSDDAEVVARGHQEHRHRARHRDRVQDRLVAVAIDDDDVAGRHRVVPHHLVRRRRAVGDEEEMVAVENARRVALGRRDRTRVVEELAQLVDRVADIRAQHVLPEELMEHLADRALEKRDAAGMAGTVPRIRAVLRVMHQRPEERRGEAVEIGLGLPDDVPCDELGRVLEHVNEAVQLAQHVVRDVPRGARLAVQEDRDIGVAKPDLGAELAQLRHRGRGVFGRADTEFFVVDRQYERRGAALLLGEAREVAVARDADDFHPLVFDRFRERADAHTARVLGAKILVDDDDGEAESHAVFGG